MRLFELANEIGVGKKELKSFVQILNDNGFEVKNSLASVDEDVVKYVHDNTEKLKTDLESSGTKKKSVRKKTARKKKTPAKKPSKKAEAGKAPAETKTEAKTETEKAGEEDEAERKTAKKAVKKTAKKAPVKAKKTKPKPEKPEKKKPEGKAVALSRPPEPEKEGTEITLAEDEPEHAQTGQKHKRADFRTNQKITEVPAILKSLDSEFTRSIRSGGGRRRRGSFQKRGSRRGRGRQASSVQRERDPNQVTELTSGLTVRELSVALGVKLSDIMGFLMNNGQMAQVNDILPNNVIELVANEFEIKYRWKAEEDLEEQLEKEFGLASGGETEEKEQAGRPPIVTFLGHVDHGKTSLLDKIRLSRVAEGESGGITQHIGAYSIVKDGHPITFLDTPGHEAFTAMRARGANLTDITVLVVAADDGVMPQTVEAFNHAKNAEVPIVVALNKCDLPGANPDRVRQQLASQLNLLPEEWGGQTGMIEVSAQTGEGIDDLLERILLEAEVLELTANPERNAVGFVIESEVTENRGVVATVLVLDGTLHRGDVILSSSSYGKVKLMFDFQGRTIDSAPPGQAVSLTGLNNVPEVGDKVYVLDDLLKARAIAEERERKQRAATLAKRTHVTLENLQAYLAEGETKELNIIVKADVSGSIEVLEKTLRDLSTDEVKINILHSAVGGINSADIILADASDAVVVGFHVIADQSARLLAASHNVQIKVYHVIYRVIEDMKAALEGMLPPEEKEVVQGHLEVRQVFKASRVGNIAGCFVTDGLITRNSKIRVIRDSVVIYDGVIDSLKRFKDDVREVRNGFECGVLIANYDDVKPDDVLEAYIIEEVARTLEDAGSAGE